MTLVRTFLAALAAITSVAAVAAEVSVLSDLDAAKALAAKEGKQIVIEFSGRTWCPPCKALVKEVIPSAEFAAFAATRVVVHLDYPRRSERTPEMIAANPQLAKLMAWAEAYKIRPGSCSTPTAQRSVAPSATSPAWLRRLFWPSSRTARESSQLRRRRVRAPPQRGTIRGTAVTRHQPRCAMK